MDAYFSIHSRLFIDHAAVTNPGVYRRTTPSQCRRDDANTSLQVLRQTAPCQSSATHDSWHPRGDWKQLAELSAGVVWPISIEFLDYNQSINQYSLIQ